MPKAWVLEKIGDIRLEEVEKPLPKENEVLVRVKAAGICGSDIPRIYRDGAHRMPLVPGHEFAGVVDSIGSDVPSKWIGKRVAVFPKIACNKCAQCRAGHPELCSSYDYIGSRRDGAFAEYLTAPYTNLLELPDSVGFEAAAMMEPMAVAANAIKTGIGNDSAIEPDKVIAVCGLGTIGLMLIMLLKEAGFEKIYAIGNKESQKKRLESLGISGEFFVNSKSDDTTQYLKDKTDSGVNLYFECVGRNESINYGIEAAAPRGSIVLVGNPYSDMSFAKDIYWKILRNCLTLKGIWNSVFDRSKENDDWGYVLKRMEKGAIDPEILISHRFPIEDLEKGFHIMRDKTEDYCKLMMV